LIPLRIIYSPLTTFSWSLETAAALVARWSKAKALGTFGHARRSAVESLRARVTLTDGDKLELGRDEHIQLLSLAQRRGAWFHLLQDTDQRWMGGKRLGGSGAPSENERDGPEQQVFGH
jgi:hypothetical protein